MAAFPLYIVVMRVAYTAVPLPFANIPFLDSDIKGIARFLRNPMMSK
jgi:hypothetical protein